MFVDADLKEFGIIDASMKMLEADCSSPLLLLWRVMFLTTGLAAFVTNDAAVIIITEPLIRTCEKLVRGVAFSFLWDFSRFHGTNREIRD
eukprot:SAG31_NODE_1314_length_8851_cov_7.233318_4_plen_90_part_00